jgi:hypothetical protein
MLRKDGLVRAREAGQSMMQHLKDMRSINDMVEEVRARIMIINTELHAIMQESESYQQETINEITKKLQVLQEEKRELLQNTRSLQSKVIQLETERELFERLIRKHEEEKTHFEEQMGYLQIQLDLDRAFLQHQTGIETTSASETKPGAEVKPKRNTEMEILKVLVNEVFDGQLHQHILSILWEAPEGIITEDLKLENAPESLFNRALMELKARNILELNEDTNEVILTLFKDHEMEEPQE